MNRTLTGLSGLLLAASALSACVNPASPAGANGSLSGPASSQQPTPSTSKNATSRPSPPPSPSGGVTVGLRGLPVTGVDCSVPHLQPLGAAVNLPAKPASLVICRFPGTVSPSAPPVRLSPAPTSLLTALALPDQTAPGTPAVCPAYADRTQAVYAVMSNASVFRLRIPQDACRHYIWTAVSAVQQYR